MNLIEGSVSVLEDTLFYLEKISAENYSHGIELMSGSSIGQHTRHFIEFYQCLISQSESKFINYCLRRRDHNIEEKPSFAIDVVKKVISQLKSLETDRSIELHTTKEGGVVIMSNLDRELFYNIEHTIHHLALIKIGLKLMEPDMVVPSHFGVAPSTIQFLESKDSKSKLVEV